MRQAAVDIISAVGEEGAADAARQLDLAKIARKGIFTRQGVDAVAALSLDLSSRLEAMHERIIRYAADAYRDIIALTTPSLLVGVTTLQVSQRLTVQQYLDRGITGFVAQNGRRWRIGTYAEMATRTTMIRAFSDTAVARMQSYGVNLVTPVGGRSACDLCRPWQGKVLSTDGTLPGIAMVPHTITGEPVRVVIDATLEQARQKGFQHPNCRHRLVGYFPGLPKPAPTPISMSAERLKRLSGAEQELRALEVRKREQKRKLAILPDDDEPARRARRTMIRSIEADIRAHVKETGVPRRMYREQLTFSDGGETNPRG